MLEKRKPTELKNIGKKIAGRLNEVGLFSENELREVGAGQACRKIKEKYPNQTLSVCYSLYSFKGALCDKRWDDIGAQRKRELKETVS